MHNAGGIFFIFLPKINITWNSISLKIRLFVNYKQMDKLAFSVLNKLLTLSPFELHGWGKSIRTFREISAEKFITC